MSTEHTSEVKVGGGKATKTILKTPFGEYVVDAKVKGYKSSEGDQKFKRPDDGRQS